MLPGTKTITFYLGGRNPRFNSVSTALIEAPLRFQFRVNKRSDSDQAPSAARDPRDPTNRRDFPSREIPLSTNPTPREKKSQHFCFLFQRAHLRLARNQFGRQNRFVSYIFVELRSACPMTNTSPSTNPEIEALLRDAAQGDVEAVRSLLEKHRAGCGK